VTHVVRASDGRRLAVESLGDPDGSPVFLMHGTPGCRSGPRPRNIVLYRLGIRLITYDRPGYQGSDRMRSRTVADAANDVATIADYFGFDRFSVVGSAEGAPHALACAALLGGRVICAAALSSLAPYDAEGLDWTAGMADSSVRMYRDAEVDELSGLIATLNEQAGRVRNNSEAILKWLRPELPGYDKEAIGDIALRKIIAQTHADALRDSADGWVDDVLALSRPWAFDLSDIEAPVKLWAGSDDVFSPPSHTYWLMKRIKEAELEVADGMAHFGSVEILPRTLAWFAAAANMEREGVNPVALA